MHNKRLEPFFLANVVLYMKGMNTFVNFQNVSKNCFESIKMLHINPPNMNCGVEWLLKTIPHLDTIEASLEYVNSEFKHKMDLITWIDASKQLNRIQPFLKNNGVLMKVRKIRIASFQLQYAKYLPFLKELIVEQVVPGQCNWKELEELTILNKVIIFEAFNETTNHVLEEIKVIKGIHFVVVKNQEQYRKVTVNPNVIEVGLDYLNFQTRKYSEENQNKLIQKQLPSLFFEDSNFMLNVSIEYSEVTIKLEKFKGVIDISNYHINTFKLFIEQGECKLILNPELKSLTIKSEKAFVPVNLKQCLIIEKIELVGNVQPPKKCFKLGKNVTHFAIQTTNLTFFDFTHAQKLMFLNVKADFLKIDLSLTESPFKIDATIENLKTKSIIVFSEEEEKKSFIRPLQFKTINIKGNGKGISIKRINNCDIFNCEGVINSISQTTDLYYDSFHIKTTVDHASFITEDDVKETGKFIIMCMSEGSSIQGPFDVKTIYLDLKRYHLLFVDLPYLEKICFSNNDVLVKYFDTTSCSIIGLDLSEVGIVEYDMYNSWELHKAHIEYYKAPLIEIPYNGIVKRIREIALTCERYDIETRKSVLVNVPKKSCTKRPTTKKKKPSKPHRKELRKYEDELSEEEYLLEEEIMSEEGSVYLIQNQK